MNHKRITMMSIVLATLMLVSLFAALSSATSVSGTVRAGTGPAASFSTYGSYLFAVDSSGSLWQGTNGNWNSLGGVCTASPAAVSSNSNYLRIDVLVRGSDGAVWQKYYQNGWSGWHSLGGQLAAGTGPAVASWSAGRLDVFAEGTNGALWHKWWNGAKWSGWESLGGKLTASPAATALPQQNVNHIWVFARGTNGSVYQKYWTGSAWSGWKSLGGQVAPGTGPAASVDWLFVQGTDHKLWRMSLGGIGWGHSGMPPEALSTASPAAVIMGQDTSVFVSTTSGNIWGSGDALDNWALWSSQGSPP